MKTIRKWLARDRFEARRNTGRSSKLDPHKTAIRAWLEKHPYSARRIFQRLCADHGYAGGYTTVKDYVRKVRPRPAKAYLSLSFAPGESAQVDWGHCGTVACGNTRRALSVFVMVLAHSRQMYVEFTLSQKQEHFLAGREFKDFRHIGPCALEWLETTANERIHRTTGRKPSELMEKERPHLLPLPVNPPGTATLLRRRATSTFRLHLDGNRYSVPAEYAGAWLDVRLGADEILVHAEAGQIARHRRDYGRGGDFEHPDHPRALLAGRKKARAHKELQSFLQLGGRAEAFYHGLQNRRLNAPSRLRKILALEGPYTRAQIAEALPELQTEEAFELLKSLSSDNRYSSMPHLNIPLRGILEYGGWNASANRLETIQSEYAKRLEIRGESTPAEATEEPDGKVQTIPPGAEIEEAQVSAASGPAPKKAAKGETPGTSDKPVGRSSNGWLWFIGAVVVVAGGLGLALRRKS